jgi:hypothetical protein
MARHPGCHAKVFKVEEIFGFLRRTGNSRHSKLGRFKKRHCDSRRIVMTLPQRYCQLTAVVCLLCRWRGGSGRKVRCSPIVLPRSNRAGPQTALWVR